MERSVEKLFSNVEKLFSNEDKEDKAGKYKAEGDTMFENQDWAGAFKVYEKGLHSLPKRHQDRATFHNQLSYCLMNIKPIDYAKVIGHCSKTLAIKSNDFPTLLRRAVAYEALGEVSTALVDLSNLLKAQPKNKMAKEMWERLYSIEESKAKRDFELKALQNELEKELEEKSEKEAYVSSPGLNAKWGGSSVDKDLEEELEIPIDPAMIEEKPGSSVSSVDKELEKALEDDFAKKNRDKACNEGSSVSISGLDKMDLPFEKLFSRLFGKDMKRILMMGTDTDGKMMILDKLKGDIVTTTTSISDCNVEIVEYKNINFIVWDVRGQDKTHYSLRTHGLIFVVDSNDRGRIVEARKELNIMLKNAELRDAMLLVFANNQALPNSMNTNEITETLKLQSLRQQSWYIQGIYASSGDGLYEGLDWLSKRIADKDFSAVDIRTDGAAQPLSPEGVAELQAYDLTLMECGNLHMQAAQNLFLSADNEMPSPEQLQSEFERVKQKYTLAKKCYDQALLVNPGLYVGFRALGELQVMMAKFHLDLAVQQNTDLSSWDSTEALELFDSAAENIEKWEKHGDNGEASSEQMKFWGSMLFERSQVECISGVEGWEENLDSAVKYLRDGHVSEHQILSLLNNHYSREPKSEATSKTLGESEFVAKIKADKVKLVTQARSFANTQPL